MHSPESCVTKDKPTKQYCQPPLFFGDLQSHGEIPGRDTDAAGVCFPCREQQSSIYAQTLTSLEVALLGMPGSLSSHPDLYAWLC